MRLPSSSGVGLRSDVAKALEAGEGFSDIITAD